MCKMQPEGCRQRGTCTVAVVGVPVGRNDGTGRQAVPKEQAIGALRKFVVYDGGDQWGVVAMVVASELEKRRKSKLPGCRRTPGRAVEAVVAAVASERKKERDFIGRLAVWTSKNFFFFYKNFFSQSF